jgi:hypothetical protein
MNKAHPTSAIYDEDGSAIVLPLRMSLYAASSRLVYLEPPAGRVWRLLQQGAMLNDAIAQVAAHYGVPADRLHADMKPVLQTLHEQGIWEATP